MTVEMTGDRETVLRLKEMPNKVRAELARAINTQLVKIHQAAFKNLSGAVLKNQSGTLRRSLKIMPIRHTKDSVTGTVNTAGSKVKYAAVHEFGYDGMVSVRAHTRRSLQQIKEATKKRSLGKGRMGPKQLYISNKHKGQGAVQVRAHSRHMKLPKRSFLGSALEALKSDIEAALKEAVNEGLK